MREKSFLTSKLEGFKHLRKRKIMEFRIYDSIAMIQIDSIYQFTYFVTIFVVLLSLNHPNRTVIVYILYKEDIL